MKNYGLAVFLKIKFCYDKILLFCGKNLESFSGFPLYGNRGNKKT